MFRLPSKYHKVDISAKKDVPELPEIRSCLGTSLAQVFFEYCHEEQKKLLNFLSLRKTSQKRHQNLVDNISSDFLLNTSEYHEIIKADIHRHILEIGKELMEKHETEIEERVRKCTETRMQEKFYVYQAKKRREIRLHLQEIHAKYENYIKTVQDELEATLEIEWANANAEFNKKMQKSVVQERMTVTHEMLRKMRTEVAYIISSLYSEFEESFRAQRENIIADFNEITRREHVKLHERAREFEIQKAKDMRVQRHELEMQNITDIMYVLCTERLRNQREKHAIHTYFEKRLSECQSLISHLNQTVDELKEEITKNEKQKKSLEQRICEILKEFQKFINFALRAESGQGETLLPLDLLQFCANNKTGIEEQLKSNFYADT